MRPPKKSWKAISNLSGGEKTLSSLALVFALHYYKPTPLYVMDEIDAALDFRNVSIIGNYIKERTRNAQERAPTAPALTLIAPPQTPSHHSRTHCPPNPPLPWLQSPCPHRPSMRLSLRSQFIIISLRNQMFELADRLVGVYKVNDCAKSVAIDPQAFVIAAR